LFCCCCCCCCCYCWSGVLDFICQRHSTNRKTNFWTNGIFRYSIFHPKPIHLFEEYFDILESIPALLSTDENKFITFINKKNQRPPFWQRHALLFRSPYLTDLSSIFSVYG